MSFSQPTGYRLPATLSLTSMTRTVERHGWPIWREEVVRALGAVSVELLRCPEDREGVLRRLSHDQVGEEDLVLSRAVEGGLLLRAAEFLDVAHGLTYLPSAVPLAPQLNLHCTAQFMDDPADPGRVWTYVLFRTDHARLEAAFGQVRGIEAYPLATEGDLVPIGESDVTWGERFETWDRVLAPFARSVPLTLSVPEPQVAFDVAESLADPGREGAQGVTLARAVAEVTRRLGAQAPADLSEQLAARITG